MSEAEVHTKEEEPTKGTQYMQVGVWNVIPQKPWNPPLLNSLVFIL